MTWKRLLAAVRDFLASMYGWQSYDEAQFQQQVRTILRPPGYKEEHPAENSRIKQNTSQPEEHQW